ncbi:MAG TPA: SagB/ThcOx family dehydrogenase [Kofleriaceae bacterium]|nr:SagB/ThcOx family dehydrogenase [Kofleriaceae bacterium]
MRLLVAAALPLAAIGAWAAWRALRGRPVRRFALNAVVGVALLAYFAITAGLGIFWVANQELPVFDPHYLFGYLTLLLVAVHVVINGPLLARFVRTRSKALSADGRALRPSVRWAARGAALALFGGACFWLGYSRGASVVTVRQGAPVGAVGVAGAVAAAPGGGMPEQLVAEDGAELPLARWYHERSKLSRMSAVGRGPALDAATRPPAFETYPAEAIVRLPDDREPVTTPAGAALDGTRAAAPSLAPAPVTLPRLATLLHLAQGVTSVTGLPGDPFYRRAAASSGALYPTVTHVVVGAVDGLAPGLYHYEPKEHALHLLRAGDLRGELAAAIAHPHAVARAPFSLVLSAIYRKSAWKYEERAYRYCLLDAGHVAANAIAAAGALGLAHRPIARFDDARLGALLQIEAARQGALLVLPFGAPAEAPAGPEPAFAPADLGLVRGSARRGQGGGGGGPAPDVPVPVMLAASRTALVATGALAPPLPPSPPLAPRAGTGTGTPGTPGAPAPERIELPAPIDDGHPLGPVIERRRSERRFGDAPLTAVQLSAITRRALGASVEEQRALRLHVVVSRVLGLAPGVYEAQGGALVRVTGGDPAEAIHAAALSQEVSRRAAAVLVFSVDAAAMAWPDASRGYRYGWLDAGIAGGRVYLQGVALGLGVSSIGAFFDDDVAALLRLDPARDLPALLVAIGPRP